jgi:mono/diheme cytochrome c family protein
MRCLVLTGIVLLAMAAPVMAGEYSADAYATCAACHLPDGVGVPGAFPPIRDRAAAIAALDGGRAYLITVVSYGLMGDINVAGNQYFGVMAGFGGSLSPADLAAALNYVVFTLNDGDAPGLEPFTTAEVEAVQAEVSLKSPAGAGELRQALASRHGDQWP